MQGNLSRYANPIPSCLDFEKIHPLHGFLLSRTISSFFCHSVPFCLTRSANYAGSKTLSYTSFRSSIEQPGPYPVSEICIIAMRRCLCREHRCKAEQPAS